MSRYKYRWCVWPLYCSVEWDRRLNTYHVEVWDGVPGEGGPELLELAERPNQAATVGDVEELLAPFGGMPDWMRDKLRREDEFKRDPRNWKP